MGIVRVRRITELFLFILPPISMSYVVASKVKELLKQQGMMCSGDLCDAASAMLEEAVKKAAGRAKENGRKTVRACDL